MLQFTKNKSYTINIRKNTIFFKKYLKSNLQQKSEKKSVGLNQVLRDQCNNYGGDTYHRV